MKWYDYAAAIWFAIFIWVSLLSGDILGILANIFFFEFYCSIRVGQENGNQD